MIVAANNHFAGFGPQTANDFRQLLKLEEKSWDNKHNKISSVLGIQSQISLKDYFS